MIKSAILGLALTVLAAGAAVAAGIPPPANFVTDTIVSYVPPGWKNSTLSGGAGHAELAEFTPTGQPTDNFTDLVGFTRNPVAPGATMRANFNYAAVIGASLGSKCSSATLRELQPPGAPPGWRFAQGYCVLKSGPAAGQVDLTFTAIRIRPTAMFTVWRAWRGDPEHLRQFIAQTAGIRIDPLLTTGGAVGFDEQAIDRITPPILKAWADTFTKVELCDLAQGEICPSFRAPADMPVNGVVAMLMIKGTNELTTTQAFELMAKQGGAQGKSAQDTLAKLKTDGKLGGAGTFSQSIALSDHDWASPQGVMAAIQIPALGARANGGVLAAVDLPPGADAATRARMQAYVVMESHLLWKLGITPDRETIVLEPVR